MDGEKHAVVMAGFTAAALAAAFGVNLLVHRRNRKLLVNAVSLDKNKGLDLDFDEPQESSIVVSETFDDHPEETCSMISEPPSEAPSTSVADRNYDAMEEHLLELREKEREIAKRMEEFERMNSCIKEMEERITRLSSQEAEITELKKRVKADEEKIEQLNSQEVEIVELKKKIKNDEDQIQQLQQEVASLIRDAKNKKKNWWNVRDASVHDAAAPAVNATRKNKPK